MTKEELEKIIAAIRTMRETVVDAFPVDDSASADTCLELGYLLGIGDKATFLLQRDLRAKELAA